VYFTSDEKRVNPVRSNTEITVRPFVQADIDLFYRAVHESIESLSYWFPWCNPQYSIGDARDWIEFCVASWERKSEFPLGIFSNATGEVVGGTGLNHVSRAYNFANVGYWVAENHRSKGYATAAAKFAIEIGFQEFEFTRLEIFILTNNKQSARVAEKVGGVFEGIARNRLHFRGVPTDALCYSLVPALVDSNVEGYTLMHELQQKHSK
jgi:ribosomal-protein-serine acetyltransferase